MKKIQAFIVLFSAIVITTHLLSETARAEGCLYSNERSQWPGFTRPLSGSDPLTETNFLESREATIASAAVIAGLFGLNALFRQYKAKQTASTEPDEQAVEEPETTAETTPEPEIELEKTPDNGEEAVAEAEAVSIEVPEEVTESTDTEEKKEVVAVEVTKSTDTEEKKEVVAVEVTKSNDTEGKQEVVAVVN
ncbi:MAG: hypothetical protein WBA77_01940 [Microcoleaceae cyanobacterium]